MLPQAMNFSKRTQWSGGELGEQRLRFRMSLEQDVQIRVRYKRPKLWITGYKVDTKWMQSGFRVGLEWVQTSEWVQIGAPEETHFS